MPYVFYYAYLNVQRPCVGWFKAKFQVIPWNQNAWFGAAALCQCFSNVFNHDFEGICFIELDFLPATLRKKKTCVQDSILIQTRSRYLLLTWVSKP